MNKTYKKSDIDKYFNKIKKERTIKEEKLDELINTDGTMIDNNDNFHATPSIVRSKKTTDAFIRGATQGPEAYFIYGGPYYGINYSYTVSEGEEILEEENISPELQQDLEAFHGEEEILPPSPPPYRKPPKFKTLNPHTRNYIVPKDKSKIVDESQIDEMKSLVDEIIRNKKDNKGMVKKYNEQGIMGGVEAPIPDVTELKQIHEKPMVIRKMDLLIDLIHKEGLNGEELAIVINHIINNVDIEEISDEHKEIIGDKIKYGEKKG